MVYITNSFVIFCYVEYEFSEKHACMCDRIVIIIFLFNFIKKMK